MLGPNVKKLIGDYAVELTYRRAKAQTPPGEWVAGSIAGRIADRSFIQDWKDATEWVKKAIEACRKAPGASEAFGGKLDDENIAGEILERLRRKKATLR
jgi:hypothetical protein